VPQGLTCEVRMTRVANSLRRHSPCRQRDRRADDQTEDADRERQPGESLEGGGFVGVAVGYGRLQAVEEAIGVEVVLGDRAEAALYKIMARIQATHQWWFPTLLARHLSE
jgi:hypothetical protein